MTAEEKRKRAEEKATAEKMKVAYKTFVERKSWAKAVSCAIFLYNYDKVGNYGYLVGLRKRITKCEKTVIAEKMKLLERTYIASAPDKFDDFMIAIEWNRPTEQKFWIPRRDKLLSVCEALQDLEDGKLDELILSMPPRVGKTTLMLFFTLWIMLRDSERSNLYCSYSDTVVSVFYQGLVEILEDPKTYNWKGVFPGRKVASTNAKDRLLNIDRMKRYASFTGRSLYGTLNGACDCSGYEIADDLISGIEEAMNKDRLMSAWSKVENNYLPRGARAGVKHLWIGTRWSLIDPTGLRLDLLQNEPKFKGVKWRMINVPALNEKDESNFDYSFGIGFPTALYQQRRASFERNNDMASWLAQYMGQPIERDGAVFSPDELRYYNGILPRDDDPDRIFMAVDPAWGGGDFVAAPVCFQYGDDIYIHDVVYDNGDKKLTQRLLATAIMRYKVQAVTVEATKTTREYADGLNDLLRSKGYRCNIQTSISHFTGTGKQQRIFDKAPDIRENMVFLTSGKRSKPYEMFMNNVLSFSMTAKKQHDDAPDSLAMAINMVTFGKNVVQVMSRRDIGI